MGIEACGEYARNPGVAVFDTAFGMGMEPTLTSMRFRWNIMINTRSAVMVSTVPAICSFPARLLNSGKLPAGHQKVIVAHLGSRASVSASIGGKCVDTSMVPPLEGLVMGTRSGDIDPAVVQFIANHENKTVDEVLNILNKKSGVEALSGISSDFRLIFPKPKRKATSVRLWLWRLSSTAF